MDRIFRVFIDSLRGNADILVLKTAMNEIEGHKQEGDEQARTRLRILSYLRLEKLIEAEGATWLDKELLSPKSERLAGTGFGSMAREALARRRQWLVSQSLGSITDDGVFRATPGMLKQRNRIKTAEIVCKTVHTFDFHSIANVRVNN